MYKKISHNIVEEHYDHPVELPQDTEKAKRFNTSVAAPLPEAVMTETTMLYRMDSRTLWTRYALSIVNFSVSEFGQLASTSKVESTLYRNAAAVGTSFVPFYGLTAGTKIGSLLNVIIKNAIRVVEIVNKNGAGADIEVYRSIWAKECEALAIYFNQLNPAQYPKDLLLEQLLSLTQFWTANFIARKEGDFSADAISLDNILKVAVVGIPNHIRAGYSSIADILSRGVIAQFPLLFLE